MSHLVENEARVLKHEDICKGQSFKIQVNSFQTHEKQAQMIWRWFNKLQFKFRLFIGSVIILVLWTAKCGWVKQGWWITKTILWVWNSIFECGEIWQVETGQGLLSAVLRVSLFRFLSKTHVFLQKSKFFLESPSKIHTRKIQALRVYHNSWICCYCWEVISATLSKLYEPRPIQEKYRS